MPFKIERYWKQSLVTLILILGVIIFWELSSFFSGLLGAVTIYSLVRNQMATLVEKRKMGRGIAALIILLEVFLCFIIPAYITIWLLVDEVKTISLNPEYLVAEIRHVMAMLEAKTNLNIFSFENISSISSYVTSATKIVISQISSFIINVMVLVFVLYFMLIGGRKLEAYFYDLLPFNQMNKKRLVTEMKKIVVSNAIGIPLLAMIQGVIAATGYYIFGAPNPLLLGLLTAFATIIPMLGTGLVWAPTVLYLGLTGNWPSAIGLALYALIIITNIDNLIRFLLQKKMADIHPLITVFGVIVGLSLFGFWGVIFGPLLISVFILLVDMFKKEYITPMSIEEE